MSSVPFRLLKKQTGRPRLTDFSLVRKVFPKRPSLGWCSKPAFKRIFKSHRTNVAKRVLTSHDDFQSLCAAIGFLEVNWSLFEQSIDHSVLIIYQSLGGKRIESELPRSYSRKVSFLKKATKSIAVLNGLRNKVQDLLQRSDNLVESRHDLTHGVVTHIESRNRKFTFSKIDYEGANHIYREYIFDPIRYPKLIADLQALGTDALHIGWEIAQIEERVIKRL